MFTADSYIGITNLDILYVGHQFTNSILFVTWQYHAKYLRAFANICLHKLRSYHTK